uniref:Uncharacterized protein n=1 Tax=Globodera rostochiensis TaxID=31243 RepID=A0A914ICC3_GLORO
MILSVAIRICAIFGSEKDEYSLEAFLTAYHRANIGRSQQRKIYSYEILPIFNNKNNGQLKHLSDEITSIKFYKTKTDSAERNSNFLLQLSANAETPFSIVEMAQQIHSGEYHKMNMYIDNMKLSTLVIEHFTGDSLADYKKENLPGSSFWASLDVIYINNLSNFMVNLLNRILNSSNLNNYFAHTDLSKELEAEQKFFSNLLNQYNERLDENLQKEIVERGHYLHFEDAIQINWNPHTKMYKLLHVLKHQWFCWNRLDHFVYRFNKDLSADLDDFCDRTGYSSMAYEQNKLLNHLQTLENFEQIKAAYEKCANIGEKNQQPMIYSYKIIEGPTLTFSYMKMLPIYKENNELSLHMSDEIAEIKIYKTPTSSADQNFDFLLKLSAVDLTPFSIVHFAQQIHCSIKQGTARLEYDNVKLSQLAIVHFTGESLTYHKKEYFPGCSFRPKVDAFCIIHLSNFMVNLLNGILNSPNLNNYFVHTGLSVELWAEQVFFSDLFKTYNDGQCVEFNRKKKLIVEREEHYLHFEDAFHINWNPYKEMFKLIQVLKYQCFCSTELYSLGFNEGFENGLRNECEEMRKNDELDGKRPNLGTDTITNDEQNMRLTPLKTLENFEQIKKAYEKLKMFLNEKRYGKCNKKEEKEDGYNAIVKLNEEFGKAFEKVLMKF